MKQSRFTDEQFIGFLKQPHALPSVCLDATFIHLHPSAATQNASHALYR
jgi:hypothetical protein